MTSIEVHKVSTLLSGCRANLNTNHKYEDISEMYLSCVCTSSSYVPNTEITNALMITET